MDSILKLAITFFLALFGFASAQTNFCRPAFFGSLSDGNGMFVNAPTLDEAQKLCTAFRPSGSSVDIIFYTISPTSLSSACWTPNGSGGWKDSIGVSIASVFRHPAQPYPLSQNDPRCFAPLPPSCTPGEELATLGDGKALTACIAGCQYDAVFYATKNSDYKWRGTGKTCDGSEVETTDDPSGPQEKEADKMCQVGTCRAKGTINGQTVDKCVPCNTVTTSNDKTSTKETTTTSPDGTTTTKTANTTSTSTTSCKDGNCTTTTQTTVVNEDGKEETTTETKEQDRGSFCEENPNHQLCKSSSWGGACGNYSCDGDAVQCAQARAAAELLCKLDVPANSEQAIAGQQAVNGTLPGSTPESISSSVGQFNTTNPYTSSCPGDVEVNVGGVASFSIPISRACPYIELIGWVLVAGATLAGARIAFT